MPISFRARSSTAVHAGFEILPLQPPMPCCDCSSSAVLGLLGRATWARSCGALALANCHCPNQNLYCRNASTSASSTSSRIQRSHDASGPRASGTVSDCQATRTRRGRHNGPSPPSCLFDAQQLVVLGDAIGAAQRTGLDLGRGRGHGDVGDGGVFGFTRAVRDDRGVRLASAMAMASQGFAQRTDLVDLDQDGVGDALVDAVLEDLRIGHEQIVTDQLHRPCRGDRSTASSRPSRPRPCRPQW